MGKERKKEENVCQVKQEEREKNILLTKKKAEGNAELHDFFILLNEFMKINQMCIIINGREKLKPKRMIFPFAFHLTNSNK